MRAGQELGREVSHDARIPLGVGLERMDALLEDAVPDGQRQSGVEVIERSGPRQPAHAAEQVVEKRPPDVVCTRAGAHAGGRGALAEFPENSLLLRRHK